MTVQVKLRIIWDQLTATIPDVTYELSNGFLQNLDADGNPPRGEFFEYYLFMQKKKGNCTRRFIHTIVAVSNEAAGEELANIVAREDVILVEQYTRAPISKDALEIK